MTRSGAYRRLSWLLALIPLSTCCCTSGGENTLRNIKVFLKEQRIEVNAQVAVESGGPIEYLLCTTTGKTYESVLKADCDPIQFHAALLSLGLEPGKDGVKVHRDTTQPTGSPVDIQLRWRGPDGKVVTARSEDFLFCTITKTTMQHEGWVFTGSRFEKDFYDPKKQVFGANIEGSLIAVIHDPWAIIDNRDPHGHIYTAYTVNEKVVPKLDTPVTVIISRTTRK